MNILQSHFMARFPAELIITAEHEHFTNTLHDSLSLANCLYSSFLNLDAYRASSANDEIGARDICTIYGGLQFLDCTIFSCCKKDGTRLSTSQSVYDQKPLLSRLRYRLRVDRCQSVRWLVTQPPGFPLSTARTEIAAWPAASFC